MGTVKWHRAVTGKLSQYLIYSIRTRPRTLLVPLLYCIKGNSHKFFFLVSRGSNIRVIQEMERYELEVEENSLSLVIRRLEDQDKGLYTCQVSLMMRRTASAS